MSTYELHPIGRVVSSLTDVALAPRQPDEGAPAAWLELDTAVGDAAADLRPGDLVLLLTWLHLGRRDVLRVHPRDDSTRTPVGVFSTRSADRPNPIGLHRVEVLAVEPARLRVRGLEAIDGTPILDLKPLLHADVRSR